MSVEYQNQDIEFQPSSIENENTLFVSPQMVDPYPFEGVENFFNHEFCYYYYNNQLTPENTFEQTLTDTFNNDDNNNNNNNNELYNINNLWSPEFEQNNYYIMDDFSYHDIVENNHTDSFNSLVGQSSLHDDNSNSIPTLNENLLLTQPLSEITQNIIENQQQIHPYCYDLSQDMQQQYIFENNISSKITEHYVNSHNNNNNQCTCISSENYYTDFQLL